MVLLVHDHITAIALPSHPSCSVDSLSIQLLCISWTCASVTEATTVGTIYSTRKLEKWSITLLQLLLCTTDSNTPRGCTWDMMMTFSAWPSIQWRTTWPPDRYISLLWDGGLAKKREDLVLNPVYILVQEILDTNKHEGCSWRFSEDWVMSWWWEHHPRHYSTVGSLEGFHLTWYQWTGLAKTEISSRKAVLIYFLHHCIPSTYYILGNQ